MQLASGEVGHGSLESTLTWLFLLMKDMLSCNYSVISLKGEILNRLVQYVLLCVGMHELLSECIL